MFSSLENETNIPRLIDGTPFELGMTVYSLRPNYEWSYSIETSKETHEVRYKEHIGWYLFNLKDSEKSDGPPINMWSSSYEQAKIYSDYYKQLIESEHAIKKAILQRNEAVRIIQSIDKTFQRKKTKEELDPCMSICLVKN